MKHWSLPVLLSLAAIIATADPASADPASADPASADPATDDIVARLEAIREQAGMASAYVLMVDRDRVLVHRGLGVRSWDDPQPVTDSDYFRLGSISKAFTGLALLKAEQQGCLRLDDEVRQHAEHLPYINPWQQPITLAMLMEHTAGWYDMSWKEFRYNQSESLEDAFRINPASRISQWPPGRHHSYSSSGPGVAAWALEQACDTDFESFIEAQVFQPLQMPSATFQRNAEVSQHLVAGYDSDPREPIRYWNFLYRPAGAMNVRPMEMANFLHMLLNRGTLQGKQIFTPEQVQRMQTPTTTLAALAGMRYGYGLGIYSDIRDGHLIHAHGGDADGYLTRFAYSPVSGRGFFVVITMFDHAPLARMRKLLEGWLVAELPAVEVQQYDPDGIELYPLTGYYQPLTARFNRPGWQNRRMRVRLSAGRLQYQLADAHEQRWKTLIPVAKNQYRHFDEPVATVWLGAYGDKIVFQGEAGNWEQIN